ncbi:MAG: hypothetical protein RBS80_03345 [Thermoguttaceae bacterium]|nr:hypothetical protein [Thermoguttaceae bacterium]
MTPKKHEASTTGWWGGIAALLEQSRCSSARTINSILTATYGEIGRRIVEFEQGGEARGLFRF